MHRQQSKVIKKSVFVIDNFGIGIMKEESI